MQIKIRAWDKVNKRMHEVLVIDWLNCLVDLDYSNIERPWYGNDDERSEVILMMYTGLKDKAGVEIYEGDIVARGKYKYEVVWNERKGWYGIDDGDNGLTVLAQHLDYIEVAGNIYENPELMEKNQPSERELKTTEEKESIIK